MWRKIPECSSEGGFEFIKRENIHNSALKPVSQRKKKWICKMASVTAPILCIRIDVEFYLAKDI